MRLLVLAAVCVCALATLAFAQVERDPSSRHSGDGALKRVHPHAQASAAQPAPVAEDAASAKLEDAARRIAMQIGARAAIAAASAAANEGSAEAAGGAAAGAASVAEPPADPDAPVKIETSAPLQDDSQVGATAAGQADQASSLAELARTRAAELDAPALPAESQPEANTAGSAESAPANANTTAAAPADGKRLVPDRRHKLKESSEPELLRGRDGVADTVQRSQPQEATPALPTPEQPSPQTEGAGTSLAQITGEQPKPELPPVQHTLEQAASTAPAAAPMQLALPGAGSAPVALVLPSGKPLMPHYDVPGSLKVITRGNPKQKLVALTFDDGPHPEFTSQILAVLDYYDVPATFFCVGVQAQKYPQWLKMMNQQGHEVASHTYDHFRLPKLPKGEKEYQIDENQRLIESLTGVTPRFLRPPGGQDDPETERMLADRKMVMAMWDVAINDTSHGRLEQDLLAVSLKKVRPGSILLAHDGVQATIDMLPELIEGLRAKGYRFVTMSELAAGL